MNDFYKYHALGNDYIIIDPNQNKVAMTPANIRLICDRNMGIGSDGILYGPIFANDEVKLQIFNPDGSEAEKSGNGVRIMSKYIADRKYIKENTFSLATLGGIVKVEIIDLDKGLITVDMGTVTFVSNEIPVAGDKRSVVNESFELDGEELLITCVSIGNPHCIVPLPEISKAKAIALGSKIEVHPLFPNKINVQLLKAIDRNNIQIEIWERGAGYTLASGSSSCAAASAAFKLGLVDRDVKVNMPGGVLDIKIAENGQVYMTGTATAVAEGTFLNDFKAQLD